MQKSELQKMGLMELREEECAAVNGGNNLILWFLTKAIEHFDEIAKGMEAGWNFDKPKTK